MPVYNDAPYLHECLQSILRQNIEKEIICINDGSTDNSLDILLQYQAQFPSIIKIINQPNQGVSIARNKGISSAIGRWLFFVDADDQVLIDNITDIIYLGEQHNAKLIKGGLIITINNNRTLATGSSPEIAKKIEEYYLNNSNEYFVSLTSSKEFLFNSVRRIFQPEFTSYFYHSSLFHDGHNFPVELKQAEDTVFLVNLLIKENINLLEVNRFFYEYYIRGDNMSNSVSVENLSYILERLFLYHL